MYAVNPQDPARSRITCLDARRSTRATQAASSFKRWEE